MSEANVWDVIASQVAERTEEDMFDVHRGVIPSEHYGVVAAFGNDGYSQDERAQREVDAARNCILAGGGTVLGFGTSEDGYSWVLLFRADNLSPDKVRNTMWAAWQGEKADSGFRAIQESVAFSAMLDEVISRHPRNIVNPN